MQDMNQLNKDKARIQDYDKGYDNSKGNQE
mgnify:CR=1 FL=1